MNWLDLVIIAALGWGARTGWRRGLAEELCHTGAAFAALVLAWHYAAPLSASVVRHVALNPAVAWLFLFLGLLVGVTLLGHVALPYLRRLFLRLHPGLDRWGGGILGTGKSLLFATVLVVFSARLPWAFAQSAVGQSALALQILSAAPALYEVVRMTLPETSGLP